MRLDYGCGRKGQSFLVKQLILVLGLLALPLTVRTESRPTLIEHISRSQPDPVSPDPRTVRLKKFLVKLHCPVFDLADDFVQAADENQLDWRLLPSISVIESGGGKAYRNNNIFGWNQGLQVFPTIRSGIHTVAFKLAKSRLYRNRDIVGKLRLYNPYANYAESVMSVMNRISPAANLKPVWTLMRTPHEFAYVTN